MGRHQPWLTSSASTLFNLHFLQGCTGGTAGVFSQPPSEHSPFSPRGGPTAVSEQGGHLTRTGCKLPLLGIRGWEPELACLCPSRRGLEKCGAMCRRGCSAEPREPGWVRSSRAPYPAFQQNSYFVSEACSLHRIVG